jgi:Rieske Fe-S protein
MQKQRRNFLRTLLWGLGGSLLQRCARLWEDEELTAGNLEVLAQDKFWIQEFNGNKIIIFFNQGKPYTLSLICTHKKCTVRFRPSESQFVCPCHKGRYDINGKVISGKPPKPLKQFQTVIREKQVVVLNQETN